MSGGYVCKRCGGPAPVGVGFASSAPGAAARSAMVDACPCGYSVATEPVEPPTLGESLGDGDWATIEQAPPIHWPSVRERFEVWPDGSVWLRPSPFSSWRGPLVAIRCDGSEVP